MKFSRALRENSPATGALHADGRVIFGAKTLRRSNPVQCQ
jgi:hypothetical protein